MGASDARHAPASCENCGTPLLGHYCYECGQSVHSPTRHFVHAVEEVLESFWHLDGRVFRTLRDLMVPGRIAGNYLAGQRARYLPPIRLFVILSVLTFFVGKLTVHIDESGFEFEGRESSIAEAQTLPEVEARRDKLLAELAVAEKKAAGIPGPNAALLAARARILSEAANRSAELRKQADPGAVKAGDVPQATVAVAPPRPEKKRNPSDEEWNPKADPVDVAWLPAFADRWITQRLARAQQNLQHMKGNANRYVGAFLGAVPTALFVLMPVFALLLKVVYLGSGRRYLEHLAVALYSHAWLLLVLLLTFLVSLGAGAIAAPWATIASVVVFSLLWMLCVPLYLFVMQLRVYGEHWAVTAVKYGVIGTVYFFMVVAATVFAALAGISS